MRKTLLRWRGRIGSLRPWVLRWGLIVALWFGISLKDLYQSLSLLNSPPLPIGELVRGDLPPNTPVTLSGTAFFGSGYFEEDSDGNRKSTIFPLIDIQTGDLVFVQSLQADLAQKSGEEDVTISGMAASTPPDLAQLIQSDLPELDSYGLKAASSLYITSVLDPGRLERLTWLVAGLGLLLAGGLVVLAVPRINFSVEALPGRLAEAPGELGAVQVTGRLHQVAVAHVTLELGKARRHFTRAEAHLSQAGEDSLLVFVHQIKTHWNPGDAPLRFESDWLAKLSPAQVRSIEPGILYTWIEQWAVRIIYQDPHGDQACLVLSFDDSHGQLAALKTLREMKFPIHWPGYAASL